jgi:microcystin-dependent protein
MAEDRQIQLRRDSEADWRSNDPTLATGEPGFVNNRNSLKIGDGSTAYTSLAALLPSGMILPFGGTTAPDGFLDCDGSAISRTTYADLFAAIGTAWGTGDGSTTFNVPDLRGVGLRGAGQHGSRTKADGTAYDGGSVGNEQNDQMQQITGEFANRGVESGGTGGIAPETSGAFSDAGTATDNSRRQGTSSNAALIEFDSANSNAQGGARTGDETRSATSSVLFLIKT